VTPIRIDGIRQMPRDRINGSGTRAAQKI